jgi:hypothetical protein
MSGLAERTPLQIPETIAVHRTMALTQKTIIIPDHVGYDRRGTEVISKTLIQLIW